MGIIWRSCGNCVEIVWKLWELLYKGSNSAKFCKVLCLSQNFVTFVIYCETSYSAAGLLIHIKTRSNQLINYFRRVKYIRTS
jgi:hypothetical protein